MNLYEIYGLRLLSLNIFKFLFFMTIVIDKPESKSRKFKSKAKSQIQNESILHPQLSPEAQRYDLSVSLGSALVRVRVSSGLVRFK